MSSEFETAQRLVLLQYSEQLKTELIAKIDAKRNSLSTSARYEDGEDPVPSNETFAIIQQKPEFQESLEEMVKKMTVNLSDLTVMLKAYWGRTDEVNDEGEDVAKEVADKMVILIQRALFKAGVDTFKEISSEFSPIWMVLYGYLQSFENGDPFRQQIWNYTRENAQEITELEAVVWVKYATAALSENQVAVNKFISEIKV